MNPAMYESLFESLPDGIAVADSEGCVILINNRAERLFGYAPEEIAGQHFSKFYTPEDAALGKPGEHLAVARECGRCDDEGWRARKDGSRFWASMVMTALRDASGELWGFFKITRDLTERKKAEDSLLLEITNVLITNLDIRRLLSAISASLREIAPHEYASLALYDPDLDKLRLLVLVSPQDRILTAEELVVPVEGTPSGQVFATRKWLILNRLDSRGFSDRGIRHLLDVGVKAGCWLPLISHGRALGCLSVASRREGAYAGVDLNLLRQIAGQVALVIDNAVAFRQMAELNDRLAEEKQYLESELGAGYNEIVGKSAALRRVLQKIETVAPTDATVLIQGETGTGKELIARAVHNLSARREHTFIKLNCAAIPIGLLESEIFGHERGSFTGAIAQKIGRLELAHHGTFFLDEVGDMPLELQPKLLRALQEREFERVGGARTIPVDVRLVAATNQDLEELVKERLFRSDLYYRLKVFPVVIPPLRERPEDIPALANYFMRKYALQMGKRIQHLAPASLRALLNWHWPGNVRELENLIERAVILSLGPELDIPLAEFESKGDSDRRPSLQTLEEAEREHILRALRESKGIVGGPQGAAARLGLKRTTLNFRMRKLGISRKEL
ncbi:MAG TPA: sigma 54-interacting transcriptional regulator [Terriglobia bacterium]|nr:sigma 54-interacting transcriptional regulator [Terriglobia bacterium]